MRQRKKIKNVLAANKSHLLNACENLNNRLSKFGKPEHYQWLNVQGNFADKNNYYFHSFIYRILAVYAWMHKIQVELIHLDTTIATKDDLELIKFMRFYGRIFSDTAFFKGYDSKYDYNVQKDHIFKNLLDELYQSVTEENGIISFNEYLEKVQTLHKKELFVFYRLIDGVNPTEDRLRWQWFQILKMLNLTFLNAYGYDYQQTSKDKMLLARNTPMKSRLNDNFVFLLKEHKLEKQKDIKRLIQLLQQA